MVKDGHIFADWELEKLNDLAEYTKQINMEKEFEAAKQKVLQEGQKKGNEEATRECIKNMLNENLSIELIAKVTGRTEEEIITIKKSLE